MCFLFFFMESLRALELPLMIDMMIVKIKFVPKAIQEKQKHF